MPFFELSEVKQFIPDPMYKKLEASSSEAFLEVEPQVCEIIANESGLAIPSDIGDSPLWVRMPAAWILAYLCEYMLTGKSREYLDKSRADYDRAIKMLNARKAGKSSVATGKIGTIGGLYE